MQILRRENSRHLDLNHFVLQSWQGLAQSEISCYLESQYMIDPHPNTRRKSSTTAKTCTRRASRNRAFLGQSSPCG